MSGIVAIVNFDGAPVDPQVLRAMAEQCAYRGPDGIRYWIRGNVGLAYLALHATPESLREVQPLPSEDGTLCLVADARLDNRPELIPLLSAKGEPVTTKSTDADLILAAYRIWGEGCPEQIIGDYAFAIWDAREQHLFCARDAFGIKSLHYSRMGSTFCLASEAQQIIQHPRIPRILDEVTVADYLVNNLNDETRSMFLDVHKVSPAHTLIANPSELRLHRYWDIDPNFQTTHQNDDEYAEHFLEIFQRAVADRLRTPDGTTIGITMSGGMDSTSVAAVAQRIINTQSGIPHLTACTYVFTQLKECDESQYSRAVADECNIDLINIPAENFWLLDDDGIFTPSLETPFMVEESLTRHTLSIFNSREARVWLTGHGGDSLLAGSPLIYADRIRRGDLAAIIEIFHFFRWCNLPTSSLLHAYRDYFIKPLIPDPIKRFYRFVKKTPIPGWLDKDFVRRTQIAKCLNKPPLKRIFLDDARQANYQHLIALGGVGRAVTWVERFASRYHLEARHPFLDRRLAGFVLSIPAEQTFRAGIRKYILRNAMSGILPEIVRKRMDKSNLSKYFQMGLRNKETEKTKALFDFSLQSRLKLIYSSHLKSIYEQFVSGSPKVGSAQVWFPITFELWLKEYHQRIFSQGLTNEETRKGFNLY
jgi:asparagine synthase (glutamine-hydrolysing)